MDEDILFESFVKPVEPVSTEAFEVHGISDELLKAAPRWAEVWPAACHYLEGKTLLIYNEAFDRDRIFANCIRHELLMPSLLSECVMETFARVMKSYSQYHDDFTWISLRDAMIACDVKSAGEHRASADCINVVQLIRNVVARGDSHAEDQG
ncbi:3'-5' exonuclease [Paenibacillus alginolyticus]|uniref:3'-5' exonuclease n=1 Tax=Paenibacillus alginolyticus TaxID=59839 RepID=UPI0003F9CB3C|nr:3'-5' exonuclease [Paenibacillus alginolyticus]MCY9666433.1 3'-5' exonuclease [Paenibacillus alginolyticus]